MEDISQAKMLVEEVSKNIEFFKAQYFTETDKQSNWYHKELERLYITRIKAELNLRKLELIKK